MSAHAPPTLVIDLLEPRIIALMEGAIKKSGREPSEELRQIAEEVLLDGMPKDWGSTLKHFRPVLVRKPKRAGEEIRSSRYRYHDGDLHVSLLNGSAKDRERRTADIQRSAVTGMAAAQFQYAIDHWPEQSTQTQRTQVLIGGKRFEQWAQEFAVIGEMSPWRKTEPKIAWRLRISALFPKRKEGMPTDFLPELRLEVVEEAALSPAPSGSDALIGVLQTMALDAASNIAYGVEESRDRGYYDESADKLPIKVTFILLPHHQETARELIRLMQSEEGWMPEEVEWSDNGIELVRIEARTTPIEMQPTLRPKDPTRAVLPKPRDPGETYHLIEIEPSSVMLCTDGVVRRSLILKLAAEFHEEEGVWPHELLRDIDLTALNVIEDHKEVEAFLEETAEAYDLEASTISSAIQRRNIGNPVRKQPVLRVLMDLATGTHEVEWAPSSNSPCSFLDRATSVDTGRFLGVKPKKLRVAKKLLAAQPKIGVWAERNGIAIEHPKSGFDGGAAQARLWNDALEAIYRAYDRQPWWQTQDRILDAHNFEALLREVSARLNGFEPPENERLVQWIHLPQSMYTGAAGGKFRAWRDHQVAQS